VPSYEEAIAAVGAPGSLFEVVQSSTSGARRSFKFAPENLRSFFDSSRGLHETFMVYEGEEWTFDRVMQEADALGHALVHEYGVRKGDRVGIAMRNMPEWVVAFAAILSIGAISVSLNAWWTEEELEYGINDAGLKVLVVDLERLVRVAGPCQRADVSIIAARVHGDESMPRNARHWRDVVEVGHPMPDVEISRDDDATILYTSGTTGFPKGAVSTHGAVAQAIVAFAANGPIQTARRAVDPSAVDPLTAKPVFILVVPLFHVTGCVPVMMSSFVWHFKLVMMHKWEPERALQLIEEHRVTNFVGVPTQGWDLMECPNFAKYDTSSLIAIGGGGAPAPKKLVERVAGNFKKGGPTLGYGLTETNAYGPGISGDDYAAHPTSTGRVPTIVMDIEIRDEEGNPLPDGASGDIWMNSPTLIRGYWNKPEATASAIRDGFFSTGDIGRIEDGFLYIEDRAKDMIIRGGENIYCTEVESAIYEHPAIFEAAVFGVPHERLGEEVAVVIMLRDDAELTTDEVTAFLKERIASFKVPTHIAFTHERLPRNPAGKFLKREYPAIYFPE
jgi:long-chain acyl-CoA synthetase